MRVFLQWLKMPRILAFDYGKKRVGLAICDPDGIVVRGLPTFQRTRVRDDIEALANLAKDEGAELLLFGDPRHMDGSDSAASASVRDFAGRVGRAAGLPLDFFDERLTTVEANEVLEKRGVRFDDRRTQIDRMAAIVLLQSYLEAQPR